jgi:hypothetical protein
MGVEVNWDDLPPTSTPILSGIELADMSICTRCGCLVHDGHLDAHDKFHLKIDQVAGRADYAAGLADPRFRSDVR